MDFSAGAISQILHENLVQVETYARPNLICTNVQKSCILTPTPQSGPLLFDISSVSIVRIPLHCAKAARRAGAGPEF